LRRYFFQTIAVAALFLCVHFAVVIFVQAPVASEYWLRELMIVKRMLARSEPSPRLLFLGGSSTLFGIDAGQIQTETGMPTLNMGLHAGLRVEEILNFGRQIAHPGDTVIMPLESDFYGCDRVPWSDWQLRNAVAWDRSYFESLPLTKRAQAVFSSGDAFLMLEILQTKLRARFMPRSLSKRLSALAPPQVIEMRFTSGAMRTSDFAYSAYNVDDHGDMQNNVGAHFAGVGVQLDRPASICPSVAPVLKSFVDDMRARNVRVVIAHGPYLVEDTPNPAWPTAERDFQSSLAKIGLTILDQRNELFMPRSFFFNTPLHMNVEGRRHWTTIMIANLRKAGIVKTPSSDPVK
jgi:hypothetical protein